MSKHAPRPQFMPIELKSGHYARNVGPLTLADARAVCRMAQAAPAMAEALRAHNDYWLRHFPGGPDEARLSVVKDACDRWEQMRAALAAAGVLEDAQ